jgi:hypothetical protein
MNNIIELFKKNIEKNNLVFEKNYGEDLSLVFEKMYISGLEFYSFTFKPTFLLIEKNNKEKNYEELKNISQRWVEKTLDGYARFWLIKIPFIVFSYIIIEKDYSSELIFFRGIFAINPVVPQSGYISLLNIKKELKKIWKEDTDNEVSIDVKYLKNIDNVLFFIKGIIKNLNLSKHFLYFYKDQAYVFSFFKNIPDFLHFVNLNRMLVEEQLKEYFGELEKEYKDKILSLYTYNKIEFINKEESFFLYNFTTRLLNEAVIVRFLNIYMELEDLFFYSDYFYSNNLKNFVSYNKLFSLDYLKSNFQLVLQKLLKNPSIYFHLEYVDLAYILIKYLDQGLIFFGNNIRICIPTRVIDINDKVVEYKNGIFFIDFNCFLDFSKKDHEKILLDLKNQKKIFTSFFKDFDYKILDENLNQFNIDKMIKHYCVHTLGLN